MQNSKVDWLVLSKITWRISQIFIYRLKNSDFILESEMTKLNQNKKSEQPDRPDTVQKLYFYLEKKRIAQETKLLTHVLQNRFS